MPPRSMLVAFFVSALYVSVLLSSDFLIPPDFVPESVTPFFSSPLKDPPSLYALSPVTSPKTRLPVGSSVKISTSPPVVGVSKLPVSTAIPVVVPGSQLVSIFPTSVPFQLERSTFSSVFPVTVYSTFPTPAVADVETVPVIVPDSFTPLSVSV